MGCPNIQRTKPFGTGLGWVNTMSAVAVPTAHAISGTLKEVTDELINAPEVFLPKASSDALAEVDGRIRTLTKDLFSCLQTVVTPTFDRLQTRGKAENGVCFGPSKKKKNSVQRKPVSLHVSDVDEDQIWVQLDSVIAHKLDEIKNSVSTLSCLYEKNNTLSFIRASGQDKASEGELSTSDDESVSSHSMHDASFDGDSLADAERCMVENSDGASIEDGDTSASSVQGEDDTSEKESSSLPKDDLFNLDEMNRFADEGERLAVSSKRESRLKGFIPSETKNADDDESTDEEELKRLLDDYEDEEEEPFSNDSENSASDDDGVVDEEHSDEESSQHESAYDEDEDVEMHTSDTQAGASLQNGLEKSAPGPTENAPKSSLLALAEKENELNALLDATERELISDKHWSLLGEASAKSRSKNSLLELHLELPQYHHHAAQSDILPDSLGGIVDEDDVQLASKALNETQDTLLSRISTSIERLVKQRIKYVMFDDVERKFAVQPAIASAVQHDDAVAETLGFKKSRVGLADVYAEQYTKEVLGGASAAETELDRKRLEMARLFATIMYKLDSLSHQRTLQKPLSVKGTTPENVSTITVEDTIPVVMSEAQRKAPEEMMAPGTQKQPEEMTQSERRALRRANKERRKKQQRGKLVSGEVTLRDSIKRSLQLKENNKKAKETAELVRRTGLSSARTGGKSQGRVKANALLAAVTERELYG